MLVYLVRHAAAFNADPDRWPDDRDRPLTPTGSKRFRRAARGLGSLAPAVDHVLASRFVRARQTALLLAEAAGWPRQRPCPALESGPTPQEALEALSPFRTAGAVALVGHEPNLSELASYLLSGAGAGVSFEWKKGGVACLELAEDALPGGARLHWFLPPRALRSLAG